MKENGYDGEQLQRSDAGDGSGVSDAQEAVSEQSNLGSTEISQKGSTNAAEESLQTEPYGDAEKEKSIESIVQESMEAGFIALNPFKIKRLAPKAYKDFVEYVCQKSEIPVEDAVVVSLFIYSLRTIIFNYFDDKKIFINISGSNEYWKWSDEPNESFGPFASRIYAESDAYISAFEKLEKQL